MNAIIAQPIQSGAPIATAGHRKTKNSITVLNIVRKPRRHLGRTVTPTPETGREYNAEIVKNVSIRLYGWTRGTKFGYDVDRSGRNPWTQPFDRVFSVGDTVEYDSFNLAYTGKIVAIGEKTVSVQPEHRSKVVRMSLYEFASRNYDLDLEALRKRNSEWYD